MNESHEHHEPTQEFTEFLARDIKRTLRHHARFAPSPRAVRARKLAVVLGSVFGTIAVLAIGLVFGTSTGYATARVETDRQRDAMAVNAATISTQLTELRFNLARARADLASSATGARASMRTTLEAAGAELRRMEASLQRIEGDLAQDHRDSVHARVTPPAKTMPVKRALAVTCNALALCADTTATQQVVTVDLPAATARTPLDMWSVYGVREFANGKLLVNDDVGRQVRLYDASLASSVVAIDTNEYGRRRAPLMRFLGDSAALPDIASNALRVIDAGGRVARTISLGELRPQFNAPVYVDEKGRLLFSGGGPWAGQRGGDSTAIIRMDLATKRIDTVGRVRDNGLVLANYSFARNVEKAAWTVPPRGQAANPRYDAAVSWLPGTSAAPIVPDRNEWVVLSDGSIAIVRGHDYHIDWIRADGRASSGPKLPFDWQSLADDSKREMLDSVYLKRFVANVSGSARLRLDSTRVRDSIVVKLDSLVRTFSFFVRGRKAGIDLGFGAAGGAALPDMDGNLWLLPSLPTDSTNTGLVYDVVNARGDLTVRVRIPADRAIAGFGKGGVVYLVAGDRANGFYIERTKVPARR
ncbi:MAG TPA: hypothetical protein VJR92_15395 [Gemmatimonadaceae bacterium]|nr:hypothetical protein [Gemmatimonadaceae bacterium]